MGNLLPRHMEIIYKLNWHFLEEVKARFGADDHDRLRRLSIIDESHGKMVRMAHLAIIGSHVVNGVAAIHSELVKSVVFPDFYALFPEKFQNKTNGVTPRRWINQANPGLASIITKWLDSEEWLKNLDMLQGLRAVADHAGLHKEWIAVKTANKARLAAVIEKTTKVKVDPTALFDVQVKRIHEYKRQQLNALYCIHRYRWIKSLAPADRPKLVTPRVVIFGGKAAPGYDMAKRIIRLIHRIGNVVNNDPDVGDLFKVVFIPNYNVSLAEIIVPASDLSQHISTAGMEASGTSNMKFAMNGGLIIGTMDGANIEIAMEIDRENMFIFGAEAHEVPSLRNVRRDPASTPVPVCPELAGVIDDLSAGKFGPLDDVGPLLDTLKWQNDYYLVCHDFPLYLRAQEQVDAVFRIPDEWTRRSILSTAGMGKFSTDRTIDEYAREIWDIVPARRLQPVVDSVGRVRSFPALTEAAIAAETNGNIN
jgi:starch phosphorylase